MSDRAARSADEVDDLAGFIAKASARDERFAASLEDARSRSALLRSLIDARKAEGLTQATVAEQMGTTQSAISDFEGGTSDPRLSTLHRYARAVGRRLVLAVLEGTSSRSLEGINAHAAASAFGAAGIYRYRTASLKVPTAFSDSKVMSLLSLRPEPSTGVAYRRPPHERATPDEVAV